MWRWPSVTRFLKDQNAPDRQNKQMLLDNPLGRLEKLICKEALERSSSKSSGFLLHGKVLRRSWRPTPASFLYKNCEKAVCYASDITESNIFVCQEKGSMEKLRLSISQCEITM